MLTLSLMHVLCFARLLILPFLPTHTCPRPGTPSSPSQPFPVHPILQHIPAVPHQSQRPSFFPHPSQQSLPRFRYSEDSFSNPRPMASIELSQRATCNMADSTTWLTEVFLCSNTLVEPASEYKCLINEIGIAKKTNQLTGHFICLTYEWLRKKPKLGFRVDLRSPEPTLL